MTVFSTRNRSTALALLGGAAVITATAAGTAAADPGAHGGERSTIVCLAPGGDAPNLPALPGGPDVRFQRVVPGEPGVDLRRAVPVEPGRGHAVPAVPAPGDGGPRVDGTVECTQITPDGQHTVVVPAPGGFMQTAQAPSSGSAATEPARPF